MTQIFVCSPYGRFFSGINQLSEIDDVVYHNFLSLSPLENSNLNSTNNILLFIPNAYFFSNFEKNLEKLISIYEKITVKRVLYLVDSFSLLTVISRLPAYYLLHKLSDFFDNIYSFSIHDHFIYNFTFYPTISTKFKLQSDKDIIKQDVFFCGIDGGRLDLLLDIAKKLKEIGVSYKFIVWDPKKAGTNIDDIYFIDPPIDYKEVINYVVHSKVLLCLKRPVATDPPLSYYESIIYNKKLLTNCSVIKDIPFTKPENVKFIDEVYDKEFFNTFAEKYNYPEDFFSLSQLIKRIKYDDLYGYLSRYYSPPKINLIYYHFSDIGWVECTPGQLIIKRKHQLESIFIYVSDSVFEISAFQKNKGWLVNSPFAGITGKSLPIFSLKIKSLKDTYKVSYRVSLNKVGWLETVNDGNVTGYDESSLKTLSNDCFIDGICINLFKQSMDNN